MFINLLIIFGSPIVYQKKYKDKFTNILLLGLYKNLIVLKSEQFIKSHKSNQDL